MQERHVAASRDSHTTCDEGSAAFPRRTLLRSLAHLGAFTHGTCRPCGSNCSHAETPPCMQARAEGCMSIRALVCVHMGRARLRARHARRQRRAQQPGRARSRLHHLARAAHAAKRLSLITRLLPRAWMRSCCTAVQTRKENWGSDVGTSLSWVGTPLSCVGTPLSRHHCPSSPSLFAQQCSSYASMLLLFHQNARAFPHRRARQAGCLTKRTGPEWRWTSLTAGVLFGCPRHVPGHDALRTATQAMRARARGLLEARVRRTSHLRSKPEVSAVAGRDDMRPLQNTPACLARSAWPVMRTTE